MRHPRRILIAVLAAGALAVSGCSEATDAAGDPDTVASETTNSADDVTADASAVEDSVVQDTGPGQSAVETAAEPTADSASEDQGATETATAADTPAETGEDSAAADTPTVDEAAVDEVRAALPEQTPEKVVTLSVGITEILVALGVTPAGVPQSEMPLPDGLDDVQRVGNSVQPDLEAIAQVGPDLVLNPSSIHESLDGQLAPLNLQTAKVPTDSIVDLTVSTLALGDLFGARDTAEELVSGLAATEAKAKAAAGDLGDLSVLLLFGSPESLMVMSSDTYAGELAARLGAHNIADDLGLTDTYTPFSMESVVEQDPDVILVIGHGDEADAQKAIEEFLSGQDAWQSLTAAENDAVTVLPFELYGVASITRADQAFDRMAQALVR